LSIAFSLVLALVAMTPILLVMQGSTELAFVAFISSLSLLFGVAKATPAEMERLAKTLGQVKLLLAVPAVWMVIQLLPLPLGISNPIWTSAAAAMPNLSFGHITINVPSTVRAFGIYCGWLILVLATMVATADRRRAEFCLAALVLATTLIAAQGIALSIFPNMLTIDAWNSFSAMPAAAAALGCVLCVAAIQRLVERRQTQRGNADNGRAPNILIVILNVSALAICLVALVQLSSPAWIAALLGVSALAAVVMMNRLRSFRGAHHVTTTALALIAAIVLLARSNETPTGSILTGIASIGSAASISTAERMSKDAAWLGTGAGTYDALMPVYQELGQSLQMAPPSLAVKLAIEWGSASPAILTLCALFLANTLLGAAVKRGRDSFYPAAAAGCVLALTFQAYSDASLLNPAVGLLSAVIVGLALAQAAGRSASS
jgi:hypothetical protein